MLSEAALLSFAATLFSMMNPIGNIGVFAGLTSDISAAKSRRVA
jgi:multiple antibiotic resistance protein